MTQLGGVEKRPLDYFEKARIMRAMLESIEKLLALQDRDQRLRTFRTELQNIPEERKARRS